MIAKFLYHTYVNSIIHFIELDSGSLKFQFRNTHVVELKSEPFSLEESF